MHDRENSTLGNLVLRKSKGQEVRPDRNSVLGECHVGPMILLGRSYTRFTANFIVVIQCDRLVQSGALLSCAAESLHYAASWGKDGCSDMPQHNWRAREPDFGEFSRRVKACVVLARATVSQPLHGPDFRLQRHVPGRGGEAREGFQQHADTNSDEGRDIKHSFIGLQRGC